MRRFLIVLSCVALIFGFQANVSSQGLIKFYNDDLIHPQTGVTYRAGVFRYSGDRLFGNSTIPVGDQFVAGLFLASDPSTPLAVARFRANGSPEVFVEPQTISVPGVAAGERAHLLVRVWNLAAGSYDNAVFSPGSGFEFGEQSFISKPLGTSEPVDMAPFTGFELDGGPFEYRSNGIGLWTQNFDNPILEAGKTSSAPVNRDTNGYVSIGGVLNPVGTGHFVEGAAQGNVGFVLMDGAASGEAAIGWNPPVRIQRNTRYTLRYSVGNPKSGVSQLGTIDLEGFPGYRVSMHPFSPPYDVVLAEDNNTLGGQVPEGEFRDSHLSFISEDRDQPSPSSIVIWLINANLHAPGFRTPGPVVAFDNLQLTAELAQPVLTPHFGAESIQLTWLDSSTGSTHYQLQSASAANAAETGWVSVANDVILADGDIMHAFVARTNTAAFFRLRSL